jgi:peptide/nickel transport system ATP-binding protein
MTSDVKPADKSRVKGSTLVEIKGLKIDGYSDDKWHPIIKGLDLTLKRGEVIGLIGESGAGKSTLGLAAMGYTKPGCKITAGSVTFDGIDLVNASQDRLRDLWGSRISYVAQSASASFNPAHKLMEQVTESASTTASWTRLPPRPTPRTCSSACSCPTRTPSANAIRTRCPVASCSAP